MWFQLPTSTGDIAGFQPSTVEDFFHQQYQHYRVAGGGVQGEGVPQYSLIFQGSPIFPNEILTVPQGSTPETLGHPGTLKNPRPNINTKTRFQTLRPNPWNGLCDVISRHDATTRANFGGFFPGVFDELGEHLNIAFVEFLNKTS